MHFTTALTIQLMDITGYLAKESWLIWKIIRYLPDQKV